MTKDVLITVSGRQFDVSDEPIELMTRGTYYLKNGKHYVLYQEQPDENEPVIKNRVKFYDGYFEMVKNGAVSSTLTFMRDQRTKGLYETGAGAVMMEVDTREIIIDETEDMLHVDVSYSLSINDQFISECEVSFTVKAG